jgi:hypothetical protein
LRLRFFFVLFFSIDLFFLWYNQRKWAWWILLRILYKNKNLLQWLVS